MGFLQNLIYRHWQKFHGVRRIELATLMRYLALNAGERILDLGCGKGAFCGALTRQGHQVVGLDPSAAALAIAKRHVDPAGRFVLGGGEELPFRAEEFDQVVSVCVLEHARDDGRVLAEIGRVLKPGSVLALTVDCLNSPYISDAFRAHHVREYHCNQLYSDAKIRQLLARAGFEMVESRYLFAGRLALAILRFGSLFHYRSVFILLFPLLYPMLWLDGLLGKKDSGMILAVKARKSETLGQL